jgi:hypothetical protein
MAFDSETPWLPDFLHPIQEEYRKPSPAYTFQPPTSNDLQYIQSVAPTNDLFDTLGLKREMLEALNQNKAIHQKCVSPLGEIHLISLKSSPVEPQWNTWWRAVRLLISKPPVRIVMFAHPRKRLAPSKPTQVSKEHVNGGAAMRCDPKSIVLYRKEELTRTLIHELFHATCSDPYYKSTEFIEADTEAWAELTLCGMAAKGDSIRWKKEFSKQVQWSVKQAATLNDHFDVKGSNDYAWRYLIGRLDVWKTLGLDVPPLPTPKTYTPVKSLRFTICEPSNT